MPTKKVKKQSIGGPVKKESFKPGELIFAKVKGHPHWPSRIDRVDEEKSLKVKRYHVFFFGTHETAHLALHDIWSYEENIERFGKPRNTKFFNEGLNEIVANPNVNFGDTFQEVLEIVEPLPVAKVVKTPKGKAKRPTVVKKKNVISKPIINHSDSNDSSDLEVKPEKLKQKKRAAPKRRYSSTSEDSPDDSTLSDSDATPDEENEYQPKLSNKLIKKTPTVKKVVIKNARKVDKTKNSVLQSKKKGPVDNNSGQRKSSLTPVNKMRKIGKNNESDGKKIASLSHSYADKIQNSLRVNKPNVQKVIKTLEEILKVNFYSVTDVNQIKPLVQVLRKVRKYRANQKVMQLSHDAYRHLKDAATDVFGINSSNNL